MSLLQKKFLNFFDLKKKFEIKNCLMYSFVAFLRSYTYTRLPIMPTTNGTRSMFSIRSPCPSCSMSCLKIFLTSLNFRLVCNSSSRNFSISCCTSFGRITSFCPFPLQIQVGCSIASELHQAVIIAVFSSSWYRI